MVALVVADLHQVQVTGAGAAKLDVGDNAAAHLGAGQLHGLLLGDGYAGHLGRVRHAAHHIVGHPAVLGVEAGLVKLAVVVKDGQEVQLVFTLGFDKDFRDYSAGEGGQYEVSHRVFIQGHLLAASFVGGLHVHADHVQRALVEGHHELVSGFVLEGQFQGVGILTGGGQGGVRRDKALGFRYSFLG